MLRSDKIDFYVSFLVTDFLQSSSFEESRISVVLGWNE